VKDLLDEQEELGVNETPPAFATAVARLPR